MDLLNSHWVQNIQSPGEEDQTKHLFIPEVNSVITSPIKTIYLPPIMTSDTNLSKTQVDHEVKQLFQHKKPKPRVITKSQHWTFTDDELDPTIQFLYVQNDHPFVNTLIKQKLSSYKSQDIQKHRYNSKEFVTLSFVLKLLQNSVITPSDEEHHNIIGCYYCKEPVFVLYKHVRDPKQWTLERLDNSIGHNCGNVVIACLQCNLKRRIMHHERYSKTKSMSIIKRTGYSSPNICEEDVSSGQALLQKSL